MITEDISVEELLEKYPEANTFLFERGIICTRCGEVFWGSLKELVESKGLDTEEIVRELNDFLGSK